MVLFGNELINAIAVLGLLVIAVIVFDAFMQWLFGE